MNLIDPRDFMDEDDVQPFDVDSDYADEEHDINRDEMKIIREDTLNKNQNYGND